MRKLRALEKRASSWGEVEGGGNQVIVREFAGLDDKVDFAVGGRGGNYLL